MGISKPELWESMGVSPLTAKPWPVSYKILIPTEHEEWGCTQSWDEVSSSSFLVKNLAHLTPKPHFSPWPCKPSGICRKLSPSLKKTFGRTLFYFSLPHCCSKCFMLKEHALKTSMFLFWDGLEVLTFWRQIFGTEFLWIVANLGKAGDFFVLNSRRLADSFVSRGF